MKCPTLQAYRLPVTANSDNLPVHGGDHNAVHFDNFPVLVSFRPSRRSPARNRLGPAQVSGNDRRRFHSRSRPPWIFRVVLVAAPTERRSRATAAADPR